MKDSLSNAWHLTEGVRFQLIAAITLVIIVGILFFAIFRQPDPTTELTPTEQSYPQATPQPFRHQDEEDTGTLVVTSDIPNVRVFIDMTDHREEEDPIPFDQRWPENKTPLTVPDMPVGEHFIFAFRPPDYDSAVIKYIIRKDEVTRIHVDLIPSRTSE